MPLTYEMQREPMVWFKHLLESAKLPADLKQHVLLVFGDLIGKRRQTLADAMLTKSLAVAYLLQTRLEADLMQADLTNHKAMKMASQYRAWMHAISKSARQLKIEGQLKKGKRPQAPALRQPPMRQAESSSSTNSGTDADAA